MPHQTRPSRAALTALGFAAAAVAAPLLVLPTGATSAAPMPAAPSRERVSTQTVQITMNNSFPMRDKLQRQDIAKVARMADVIGWQEIASPNQQKAIRNQDGWATYWPDGFSKGQPRTTSRNQGPISYRPAKWQRVGAGTRFTSAPIKDVSGDRWISWVILRDRRTGVKVARWNLHFVPGAWTTRGTPAQKRNRAELKRAWNKQQRITSALITELGGRAHAVIGGGDVNRIKHPFLGDQVVYDALPMRLDHLVHVANPHVRATGMTRETVNSDHPAVRVTYGLKRWRPSR